MKILIDNGHGNLDYTKGKFSPIKKCKEVNGYSMAWFHHKGRNKHHWEYWMDDFEKGFIPKKMPFKYALEMMCDFLGAGRAYYGDKFSIEAEYEWWQNKRKLVINTMHTDTFKLIDTLFNDMNKNGIEAILKDRQYINKLHRRYEIN